MKMKLLLLPILMIFLPAIAEPAPTEGQRTWPRTTGKQARPHSVSESKAAQMMEAGKRSSDLNLNGRMFTLSHYGGVIFYHPNYHFQTPYPTSSYKARAPNTTTKATTTTTKAPNTTTKAPNTTTKAPNTTTIAPNTTTIAPNTTTIAPNTTTIAPNTTTKATTTQSPSRSVSVCLRYVTDAVQQNFPLFTLSSDTFSLSVQGSFDMFVLSYYDSVVLQPIVHLWPDIKQDIWTSVCLTVDTSKGVVQMFSGGYMSPRKVMPYQYAWSGEPVISFPGFDGQLTDVQVWDYPLRYRDIFYYMSRSYYGSYSGSVISWSNIRYINRGKAVLEDTFDIQAKVKQKSRQKEKKMRFFSVEEENKPLL